VTPDDLASADFPTGALVVALEGTIVQTVQLGSEALTIGRLPQNRLVLQNAAVSRYHAEVRMEGGQATLTDVGSSGGTFVGEEQLRPNQPFSLAPGQVFRVGPFDCTYIAPTAPKVRAEVEPVAKVAPASPPARGKRGDRAAKERDADGEDGSETIIQHPQRPRLPVPGPVGERSRYLRYLPGIYHDADFLGRMLLIYEELWEPLEWRQNHIDFYFDPRTAPREFLGWLATWIGLTLDKHWPEERRRLLLDEAMELYRWRGTHYGLARMIEVCTGISATITDVPGRPFVMRVQVRIPRDSYVRAEMIERLVQGHKPAHVGYVLEVST